MKKCCVIILLFFGCLSTNGQYILEPADGYSERIGLMVYMLEELKSRITGNIRSLNQDQTDYLLDEKGNRIGAIIMHLAATEKYYQVESLEGREFSEAEEKKWLVAAGLGSKARKEFKGKPISYYLNIWDEVRQKTLTLLKQKDDEWFGQMVDESVNHHWVWYHVMEHQANHMGQIELIKNRFSEKP